MPDVSTVAVFAAGATLSILASALLAARIERLSGRFGLSEALVGMLAALAADSPEITSTASALHSGDHVVGVGVVLGSNVFNLAALLGLGAVVAGRITLHRRVVVFEGAVAMAMVGASLLVVAGLVPAVVGLAAAAVVLGAYLVAISLTSAALERLPLPSRSVDWLARAVREEERELEPFPRGGRGHRTDLALIALALVVVVGASLVMEHEGVVLGGREHWPAIVTGGIVLAAITSLPNAVAAVYLARRGRSAAVLSEAMNSNALNVVVGLLLTGAVLGLGASSGAALTVDWWYGGLTAGCLLLAWWRRGLGRLGGLAVIAAYAGFVALLVVRS